MRIYYKAHFLSLVKFCKDTSTLAAETLGIIPPVFVNLDAHANMAADTIPRVDILGMMNLQVDGTNETNTVHISFCVSTWNDADLLRHVDIIDVLTSQLTPGGTIPMWGTDGSVVSQGNWMSVTKDIMVSPVLHVDLRPIQLVQVRLQSGYFEAP